MNSVSNRVRPVSLVGSLIFFGIPTLLMWVATHWAIPELHKLVPGPDVLCWFIAAGSLLAGLLVTAFVAYWLEQGRVTLQGFAERFRFRRLSAADIGWSLGTLVICAIASAALMFGWRIASQTWETIPQPDVSPSFMKVEPLTRDTAWILIAWLPMFFFNIAGEELWWRGYLLPRQERTHGRRAWLLHGVGLLVFHLPIGIGLSVAALPFLFGLPFVVQQRQNIWTGFLVHGLLNGGGFVAVTMGLTPS